MPKRYQELSRYRERYGRPDVEKGRSAGVKFDVRVLRVIAVVSSLKELDDFVIENGCVITG